MSDKHAIEEEQIEDVLEEIDPELDELVAVFVGDLHNCRERLYELEQEGIPSIIIGQMEGGVFESGPPVLELCVRKEDLEDVAEIFEEIWEEILDTEGVDNGSDSPAIDFSKDTVVCPGCQSEISEVTEEGECIECGLFLGFPDEGEEEDEPSGEDSGR